MKRGWEVKKLGDIFETGAGGTPLKSQKMYYDGGTIPWLMSGEVSQGTIYSSKLFITEEGLKKSSAKLFPINSVLVAMYGATAGAVGLLKFESATNQAVCGILPNTKMIPEFLYYCMLSKEEELISQAVGNAQPNISQSKIRNLSIPLPPLPEQKSIVAILEKAFSAIDKAKENALKNLQNAKELFESYLNSVFANPGKDWVEKSFANICTLQRGYDLPTNSRNNGSFPLVSSNGITDWINVSKVKSPGVVTGRSGTIGNVHFINQDFWPLNTSLFVKDFNSNSEKFIFYFLKQFNLNKYATGAGVPTLNRNNVHNVKVTLPASVTEQESIVVKLDRLLLESEKMVLRYEKKLSNLDELKKSILQKAFNGELKTTSDIEI